MPSLPQQTRRLGGCTGFMLEPHKGLGEVVLRFVPKGGVALGMGLGPHDRVFSYLARSQLHPRRRSEPEYGTAQRIGRVERRELDLLFRLAVIDTRA